MNNLPLEIRSNIQLFDNEQFPIFNLKELIENAEYMGINMENLVKNAINKHRQKSRTKSLQGTIVETIADCIAEYNKIKPIKSINIFDKKMYYYIVFVPSEMDIDINYDDKMDMISNIIDKIDKIDKLNNKISFCSYDRILIKIPISSYKNGLKIDFLHDIVNMYKFKYYKKQSDFSSLSYNFMHGWNSDIDFISYPDSDEDNDFDSDEDQDNKHKMENK